MYALTFLSTQRQMILPQLYRFEPELTVEQKLQAKFSTRR